MNETKANLDELVKIAEYYKDLLIKLEVPQIYGIAPRNIANWDKMSSKLQEIKRVICS